MLEGFLVLDSDIIPLAYIKGGKKIDVRQCIIYDHPHANARLIGVEYMISAKLFETLSAEEKKLWHSHIFEVKSGMVCMPAPNTIPQMLWEKAETAEMEQVIGLYGKT